MVLAAPGDPSGPWICDGLQQRGLDDVCLISVDALVYSRSLTHRLSRIGAVTVEIQTPGGVVGPALQATVNRAEALPLRHLQVVTSADREYATGEIYALFTSMLHGLSGQVVNRAGPRGLSGPILGAGEWASAAASAGLKVRPLRWPVPKEIDIGEMRSPRRLFVVGSAVIPAVSASSEIEPPPNHVAEACCRLARRQEVELLAVDFELSEDCWLFIGAYCTPDVRPGGAPLLDALAAHLR